MRAAGRKIALKKDLYAPGCQIVLAEDRGMTWNRATSHLLAAGLAAGALSLVGVGCDSGSAVETVPATAADRDAPISSASNGPPIHRPGDDASVKRDDSSLKDEMPVEAPRHENNSADVALTSASASGPETSADAAASDPPPLLADASVDASKYPGGIIPASPNAQPLPGGPRLLVPHKTFRSEGKPTALRVSYDDLDLLKVLNVDPVPPDVVDQFPDWLRDLDGQRIRIRGFMFPAYEEMLSAFVLTRDTGACCFGPNPKVYYLIGVKLKDGTRVRYVQNRPVDVVGTFHIQPVVSDGNWFQIYKITDAAVVE